MATDSSWVSSLRQAHTVRACKLSFSTRDSSSRATLHTDPDFSQVDIRLFAQSAAISAKAWLRELRDPEILREAVILEAYHQLELVPDSSKSVPEFNELLLDPNFIARICRSVIRDALLYAAEWARIVQCLEKFHRSKIGYMHAKVDESDSEAAQEIFNQMRCLQLVTESARERLKLDVLRGIVRDQKLGEFWIQTRVCRPADYRATVQCS